MPVILTSNERLRLAKLAGMLGSSFDGERLNALSAIQRMADQKKCRIEELLLNGQTEVVREVIRYRESPATPRYHEKAEDDGWKQKLQLALELHGFAPFLSEWEATFAADVVGRGWSQPTDRQAAVIQRIFEKYQLRQKMRGAAA
jgi:hypothetical protein